MSHKNVNIKQEILNLSNKKFKVIYPGKFIGQHQITELYLCYNEIESIEKKAFIELHNLISLNLNNNEIKSIEKDAFVELKNLKELCLNNNKLNHVHKDWFIDKGLLTGLYLNNNEIKSIEKDAFVELKNLISLDLSNNTLKYIDKDLFIYLYRSVSLSLGNNEIESIDKDAFIELHNLLSLDLSNNKLKEVHKDWFIGKRQLTRLSLGNNEIESIDNDAFVELENLESLFLSNNKLKYVDKDWFNKCLCLRKLVFVNNFISNFSYNRSDNKCFENLKFFDVHGNCFYSFPVGFLSNTVYIKKARFFDKSVVFNFNFSNLSELTIETISKHNQFSWESNNIRAIFNAGCLSEVRFKSQFRNFFNGIQWANIPKDYAVVIGINGTGKTSVLCLVEHVCKDYIKNNKESIVSCRYFSSAHYPSKFLIKNKTLNNFLTREFEFKKHFIDYFYKYMDSFNALDYLYFIVLIGLQNKINDFINRDFKKYNFKNDKLNKAVRTVDSFLNKYWRLEGKVDNVDLLVKEFYSLLKKVGKKIEDYLNVNDKIELSPGENLIILLSFWSIHAEHIKFNPQDIETAENKIKILLLDEPDVHMHPRLIKSFMNILNSRDLNYLGVQVIITTHNVITVNFTPKEHLFEIKYENDAHIVQNVSSHRSAFLSLTDELVPAFNHKLTKIVFVESEDDMKFYNLIFNQLSKFQMLHEIVEINLHFIPIGNRQSTVKSIVKDYLENSKSGDLDDFIYGIVDKDNDKNKEQCNIEVLNRYAIENYIFDPIYLFFYFKEKHKSEFLNLGIFKNKPKELLEKSTIEFKKYHLQLIVNFIEKHIEEFLNLEINKSQVKELLEKNNNELIKNQMPLIVDFIEKHKEEFINFEINKNEVKELMGKNNNELIKNQMQLIFDFLEKHIEEFLNLEINKKKIKELMEKNNNDLIKNQNYLQSIVDIFTAIIVKRDEIKNEIEKIEFITSNNKIISLDYHEKFIDKQGHDLEANTLKRIFNKIMPSKVDMFEFLKTFEIFFVPIELISIFESILFYKSNEYQLDVLKFLYEKPRNENVKALASKCIQPLYVIEMLRNDLERAKKIFKNLKKNNLNKDDISDYQRLESTYESYSEKDYTPDNVNKKQFLDKDIVNLFSRILDKKSFVDGSIENYEHIHILCDLLKEYERKIEKDRLVERKNALIQSIMEEIRKIKIEFDKGKELC